MPSPTKSPRQTLAQRLERSRRHKQWLGKDSSSVGGGSVGGGSVASVNTAATDPSPHHAIGRHRVKAKHTGGNASFSTNCTLENTSVYSTATSQSPEKRETLISRRQRALEMGRRRVGTEPVSSQGWQSAPPPPPPPPPPPSKKSRSVTYNSGNEGSSALDKSAEDNHNATSALVISTPSPMEKQWRPPPKQPNSPCESMLYQASAMESHEANAPDDEDPVMIKPSRIIHSRAPHRDSVTNAAETTVPSSSNFARSPAESKEGLDPAGSGLLQKSAQSPPENSLDSLEYRSGPSWSHHSSNHHHLQTKTRASWASEEVSSPKTQTRNVSAVTNPFFPATTPTPSGTIESSNYTRGNDPQMSVTSAFGATIETPKAASVSTLLASFNSRGSNQPLMPMHSKDPRVRHSLPPTSTSFKYTEQKHSGVQGKSWHSPAPSKGVDAQIRQPWVKPSVQLAEGSQSISLPASEKSQRTLHAMQKLESDVPETGDNDRLDSRQPTKSPQLQPCQQAKKITSRSWQQKQNDSNYHAPDVDNTLPRNISQFTESAPSSEQVKTASTVLGTWQQRIKPQSQAREVTCGQKLPVSHEAVSVETQPQKTALPGPGQQQRQMQSSHLVRSETITRNVESPQPTRQPKKLSLVETWQQRIKHVSMTRDAAGSAQNSPKARVEISAPEIDSSVRATYQLSVDGARLENPRQKLSVANVWQQRRKVSEDVPELSSPGGTKTGQETPLFESLDANTWQEKRNGSGQAADAIERGYDVIASDLAIPPEHPQANALKEIQSSIVQAVNPAGGNSDDRPSPTHDKQNNEKLMAERWKERQNPQDLASSPVVHHGCVPQAPMTVQGDDLQETQEFSISVDEVESSENTNLKQDSSTIYDPVLSISGQKELPKAVVVNPEVAGEVGDRFREQDASYLSKYNKSRDSPKDYSRSPWKRDKDANQQSKVHIPSWRNFNDSMQANGDYLSSGGSTNGISVSRGSDSVLPKVTLPQDSVTELSGTPPCSNMSVDTFPPVILPMKPVANVDLVQTASAEDHEDKPAFGVRMGGILNTGHPKLSSPKPPTYKTPNRTSQPQSPWQKHSESSKHSHVAPQENQSHEFTFDEKKSSDDACPIESSTPPHNRVSAHHERMEMQDSNTPLARMAAQSTLAVDYDEVLKQTSFPSASYDEEDSYLSERCSVDTGTIPEELPVEFQKALDGPSYSSSDHRQKILPDLRQEQASQLQLAIKQSDSTSVYIEDEPFCEQQENPITSLESLTQSPTQRTQSPKPENTGGTHSFHISESEDGLVEQLHSLQLAGDVSFDPHSFDDKIKSPTESFDSNRYPRLTPSPRDNDAYRKGYFRESAQASRVTSQGPHKPVLPRVSKQAVSNSDSLKRTNEVFPDPVLSGYDESNSLSNRMATTGTEFSNTVYSLDTNIRGFNGTLRYWATASTSQDEHDEAMYFEDTAQWADKDPELNGFGDDDSYNPGMKVSTEVYDLEVDYKQTNDTKHQVSPKSTSLVETFNPHHNKTQKPRRSGVKNEDVFDPFASDDDVNGEELGHLFSPTQDPFMTEESFSPLDWGTPSKGLKAFFSADSPEFQVGFEI